MTQNLWGELPKFQGLKPPITILKEQATAISELTKRVILGEVNVSNVDKDTLVGELEILAPALDNYRVSIVRVQHQREMYPLAITDMISGGRYKVDNEEGYVAKLAEIFTSNPVQRILGSLIVQSTSEN